jgi:hypothetical protein
MGNFSRPFASAQRRIKAHSPVDAGRPSASNASKKRAGFLRLNGDEVTYALTGALRRVMRPTTHAARTSLLTGPLCQPLANSALTASVMIGERRRGIRSKEFGTGQVHLPRGGRAAILGIEFARQLGGVWCSPRLSGLGPIRPSRGLGNCTQNRLPWPG